jgi:hypothetical protein
MLAVLAGLFAGSLGFAEYLVVKRGGGVEVVPRLEKFGFSTAERSTLRFEIAARSGKVGKRERLVEVFSWASPDDLSYRDESAAAMVLFEQLMQGEPQTLGKAQLLGVSGVEAAGTDDQDEFTILRLAAIEGQVVAISYSGPLPYTDADKNTFNAICAAGVELRK